MFLGGFSQIRFLWSFGQWEEWWSMSVAAVRRRRGGGDPNPPYLAHTHCQPGSSYKTCNIGPRLKHTLQPPYNVCALLIRITYYWPRRPNESQWVPCKLYWARNIEACHTYRVAEVVHTCSKKLRFTDWQPISCKKCHFLPHRLLTTHNMRHEHSVP